MPKAEETVLEIDLKALKHNVAYLKSKLKRETLFGATLKDRAYGTDACKLGLYLQKLNVDYFIVAYVLEGIALRKAGVTTPILVIHPQPVNFEKLIVHSLEPTLYTFKTLDRFIETASQKGLTDYPVHVNLNTGLNRLGFLETAIAGIASKLKATSAIRVKGLYSHLAASEDPNEAVFSMSQINQFKASASKLIRILGYKPMLHMCNTSGVLNYPEAHFDMVRIGIGLHGFGSSNRILNELKPVATLKTIITQINALAKGETVGYNRAFTAKHASKVATLPIGHGDGISRYYGNGNASVTINGKRAPIVGNVCMDMLMVDVTGIDCEEGDEVVIFDSHTTVEELAKGAHTISYELLASLSQRIKRLFLE